MDADSATRLARARYSSLCRNQPLKNAVPFVVSKRAIREEVDHNQEHFDVDGNNTPDPPISTIDDFLDPFEDGGVNARKEAVAQFCDGASLSNFTDKINAVITPSRIRLDDQSDCGKPRIITVINISPDALRSKLKEKRFDHPILSDVPRRTVTIWDLNKYHVFALAEAASDHERCRLIATIYNFLSKRSEIKVQFSIRGGPSLGIFFSFPIYLIRQHKEKPSDQWESLPFLQHSEGSGLYMLYKTTVVATLCADSDTTWLTYVLRETIPRGEHFWNCTDDDDSDCGEGYDESDCDVPGQGSALDLDPNVFGTQLIGHQPSSILEYALCLLARIVKYRLHESEYLVLQFEPKIDAFLADYTRQKNMVEKALRSSIDAQKKDEALSRLREQRDNVRMLLEVLDRILTTLRASLDDWSSFLDPGGGAEYFVSEDLRLLDLWVQIMADFRDIAKVKTKTSELREKCSSHVDKMEWDVSEELYKMAQRKYENAEEVTKMGLWSQKATGITLMFIAPLALSSALLAMPKEALPFKASVRAFFLLVLIMAIMLAGLLWILANMDSRKNKTRPTTAVVMSTLRAASFGSPTVTSYMPHLPDVGIHNICSWVPSWLQRGNLRSAPASDHQDVELGNLHALPRIQRPVSVYSGQRDVRD